MGKHDLVPTLGERPQCALDPDRRGRVVGTLDEHVWTCTQSQHTDLGVTEIGQAGEAHFGASPHARTSMSASASALRR